MAVSVLSAWITPTHTNIINVNWTVSNNMTDYNIQGGVLKLEFLDESGATVIFTSADQTVSGINAGQSVSGSYSHPFQNSEQNLIKQVRATVTSVSGVVFYRSAQSVMIAPVDMRSA